MLQMIANPTGFFDRLAARYGDSFTLRVLGPGSPPVVFLSNPEAVQAVFTTLAGQVEFGKVTQVFRPLVGNESLIMQQGSRHQHQRKLLMPALHQEKLLLQAQLICDLVDDRARSWHPGEDLLMRREMAEVSLAVILQVVFGLVPGERYDRLKAILTQLLENITGTFYSVQFFLPPLQRDLGPGSPWGRFRRQIGEIDGLIYQEIHDRRGADLSHRRDILSLIMTATDESGQPLRDQELRDQLITLLLLGHETTASALAWAFYWLHRQPEVLIQLRAEIEPLGDCDPITLAEQPYLTAVCKEALRLYPIALISQPRRLIEPVELEGWAFSPGTVLIPCIYAAHRRSATYGPDVLDFRPDRFLERKFSASEFFPFGGGARSCIGMALSMLEMKLALGRIIQQCHFEAVGETKLYPQRRGITFVPPDGAKLRLKP
jgi:cytochrome P450 family 110